MVQQSTAEQRSFICLFQKNAKQLKREQWSNGREFVLTMVSYVIGLAAFLFAYFILVVFTGLPLVYLELVLGQFASLTPPMLFKRMVPAFAGMGYSMMVVILLSNITYGVILSRALHFFCMSFYGIGGVVPWLDCSHDWNTDYCFDNTVARKCNSTHIYFKGACLLLNKLHPDQLAYIRNLSEAVHWRTPASEYMHKRVLQQSAGFHEFGYPTWDGTMALFFSWLLIFFVCRAGLKVTGKIAYFTGLFPYVVLVALVVKGNLLDGASDGLMFYLKPNFTQLTRMSMWRDAASQVFFSLSLGEGGLITLASYNKFNHNLFRDTLIMVFGDLGTSILAGFAVFPILGYVAKETYPDMDARKRVELFAESGTSLTFIAFPDALTRLPVPWLFSALFFLMLITLSIGPQVIAAQMLSSSLMDQWPSLRRHRISIVGCYCLFSFLFGLFFVAPGGVYLLKMFEQYVTGLGLMILVLLEVLIVSFVYGFRRLVCNLRTMMGKPANRFWRLFGYPVNPFWWICWISVIPLLLWFVIVADLATTEATTEGDYVFPIAYELVGGAIALVSFGWIPGAIIFKVVRSKIKGEAFGWLLRPTDDWGPSKTTDRERVERDERAVYVRKG